MNSKRTKMRYPRIEFTQDVYEKHLNSMERIVSKALQGKNGWDHESATTSNGWSHLTTKGEWEVLSLQKNVTMGTHEYLCIGSMKSTLEALQDALYVNNSDDFRALNAVLYENAILDAAVLNITHRRTNQDRGQFFGVKYIKLLVQVINEDDQELEYIYLEFSGTRLDSKGRKTYFVVSDPVAIKPLGDGTLELSFGERCSCVKLYREGANGCIDVTIRAKIEPGASASHAKYHQIHGATGMTTTSSKAAGYLILWKSMGVFIPIGLTKDLTCISKEASAPEALKLTTGQFSPTWAHDSKCFVCFKSFHLIRRKHHCRRCGSSICRPCTVELYCVDRPTKTKSNQALVREKFCKSCFIQAKIQVSYEAATSRRNSVEPYEESNQSNTEIAHLYSPRRDGNGQYFFLNDNSSQRSSWSFKDENQQPFRHGLSNELNLHVQDNHQMMHPLTPNVSEYTPQENKDVRLYQNLSSDINQLNNSFHKIKFLDEDDELMSQSTRQSSQDQLQVSVRPRHLPVQRY